MNIELDIYLLKKYQVSADQYLILYFLSKKQYDALNMYLIANDFKFFEDNINHLISKNYLIKFEYSSPLDIRGYNLTEEGLEIVSNGIIDYFDEFLQEFPDKVSINGVPRYLKSDVSRCRTKYNRLTKGKKYIHEKILNCLRFEVDLRERTNGLGYFKKLPTWLDEEEWKAYEEDASNMNTNQKERQLQYGSTLE